jgi:hypothetical protein
VDLSSNSVRFRHGNCGLSDIGESESERLDTAVDLGRYSNHTN